MRLKEKDYAASVRFFEAVLKHGISSFEVHFYVAQGLVGLGRRREATPHFEEAARLLPSHAAVWEELADNLFAGGDAEGALRTLRKGEAALPKEPRLRLFEARILQGLGRKAGARAAYEAALPLAPKNARARAALGDLLRDMGDIEGALRRQQEAVELEPKDASYWNSLGMTLGGQGRMPEAEKAFREAWRLDDKNHHHAFNLGLALLRQGRPEEARPFFERAIELAPGFTPARAELQALGRGR